MRSTKLIHIVSCHAEGEVGDVIVGGVAPPPGDTLWEQSRFIARTRRPAQLSCSTSRAAASSAMSICWCRPRTRGRQMGFIIMEPEDTPPMSGSNSICVATVLLDTGIVADDRAGDAAGARGARRADRSRGAMPQRQGRAHQPCATFRPLPTSSGAKLEVEGLGTLTVDTAYGGDSFVMVDAGALGLHLHAGRGPRARRDRRQDHRAPPTSSSASPIRSGRMESHFLLPGHRAGATHETAC